MTLSPYCFTRCVIGHLYKLKNCNRSSTLTVSIVHLTDAAAWKPKGVGMREATIRDEWLSRWGIMGNSPLSERHGIAWEFWRGPSQAGWERKLIIQPPFVCVGSGSAGKSSGRRAALSKRGRRGCWGEPRNDREWRGGGKEMTGEGERKWFYPLYLDLACNHLLMPLAPAMAILDADYYIYSHLYGPR